MNNKNNNNGLTNDFYKIKEWVVDVDDLAESLNLDGYQFNILKSLFGLNKSRHNGTTPLRDSNKMLHYSIKNLVKYYRETDKDISDIISEVINNLDDDIKTKIKNKINI